MRAVSSHSSCGSGFSWQSLQVPTPPLLRSQLLLLALGHHAVLAQLLPGLQLALSTRLDPQRKRTPAAGPVSGRWNAPSSDDRVPPIFCSWGSAPLTSTPNRRRAFPRCGALDKIRRSRHIHGMTLPRYNRSSRPGKGSRLTTSNGCSISNMMASGASAISSKTAAALFHATANVSSRFDALGDQLAGMLEIDFHSP